MQPANKSLFEQLQKAESEQKNLAYFAGKLEANISNQTKRLQIDNSGEKLEVAGEFDDSPPPVTGFAINFKGQQDPMPNLNLSLPSAIPIMAPIYHKPRDDPTDTPKMFNGKIKDNLF